MRPQAQLDPLLSSLHATSEAAWAAAAVSHLEGSSPGLMVALVQGPPWLIVVPQGLVSIAGPHLHAKHATHDQGQGAAHVQPEEW